MVWAREGVSERRWRSAANRPSRQARPGGGYTRLPLWGSCQRIALTEGAALLLPYRRARREVGLLKLTAKAGEKAKSFYSPSTRKVNLEGWAPPWWRVFSATTVVWLL